MAKVQWVCALIKEGGRIIGSSIKRIIINEPANWFEQAIGAAAREFVASAISRAFNIPFMKPAAAGFS